MGFRNAVSDCDLTDIQMEGHRFTWIKSAGTPHVIEERLDRAMASSDWLALFPEVKLINLLASHSDHSPILLQTEPVRQNFFKYSFKFENLWLKEEDVDEVVEEGWCREGNIEVTERVEACAEELQRWGRRKRTRFKEEIETCCEDMEKLRGRTDQRSVVRYQEVQNNHARLLVQKEAYWRQRAKMHWLKEGDLNTKFFHMSANARCKVKKVVKLVNDDDVVVTNQEGLCEVAKSYFESLFKAVEGNQEPVLSLIQPRVTDIDNERLTAPILKEEIHTALMQMHPDKSPGPDGFNPAFYQHFWQLCGDDIYDPVKSWLDREAVAERILQTPLFEEVKEDQLVWQFENHGMYTVKSGYKNHIKSKAADSNNNMDGGWGALWRSSAPPKTKHLLWRVCRTLTLASVSKETNEIAGTVAAIARCIWHNRNNWLWNGTKDSAKGVALMAAHMIGEWRAVNMHQQQQHLITTCPRDGWLKCNVDASFSQASGHTGWGWCLRNSNGVFVAAGTNMSTHKLTIVEGEAMAILEAMREAISRRWFNIVFESDSKVVVDAIHANHQGVSELSSIIASIRLLLQCNQNFEISSLSDKRIWRLTL
ncbi:hypothetical protein TSUD_88180 [Trifolium subterraneum]|uniref:RNase H type-1 domain-containing protein n=1 Tax=Trifolium subterraneum TaxID=3900 RepID=A0A2Z6NRI4_TRISU|nr:hypothetical protein TSUD_88180 [Trifolium subterraneum]